ncbi:MAG: DoxX family protein [Alistipes sp.]
MRQKRIDELGRTNYIDWGVLYLRMVLGMDLLLHNIGKMQDYNEIINSYPSILYMSNATSFVLIMVAEVVMAVLLMLGFWVRFAAATLTIGMLWVTLTLGFPAGGATLLLAAVYFFLVIVGGGVYAFDAVCYPLCKQERKPIEH